MQDKAETDAIEGVKRERLQKKGTGDSVICLDNRLLLMTQPDSPGPNNDESFTIPKLV